MEDQALSIAVVGGTGAEGSAIALRLANAGYRVTLGTRDSAKGARVTCSMNSLAPKRSGFRVTRKRPRQPAL